MVQPAPLKPELRRHLELKKTLSQRKMREDQLGRTGLGPSPSEERSEALDRREYLTRARLMVPTPLVAVAEPSGWPLG